MAIKRKGFADKLNELKEKNNKTSNGNKQRPSIPTEGLDSDFQPKGLPSTDKENKNLYGQVTQHEKKQDELMNKAYGDVDKLTNEVYSTPGVSLNPVQNQPLSKSGRYGNLNNKSFNDTLKLSRQADAYNNRPLDNMRLGGHYNAAGGSYDLGVETLGYERPKIETQEMRQMRANENIDLQQRQLDDQLQAAINAKDYDAFKQALTQKFNIQLSDYTINKTMENYYRTQTFMDMLGKDREKWQKIFIMKFGIEAGRYMYDLAQTNNLLAQQIMNIIYGMGTFSRDQAYNNALYTMVEDFCKRNNYPVTVAQDLINKLMIERGQSTYNRLESSLR